jgi:glycosyltransferase involved in cell wall biosynthesis
MSGKFHNSGIPQETRMLFKIFSDMAEIKPIGLICSQNYSSVYEFKMQKNAIKQALAFTNYFFALEEAMPKSQRAKFFFVAKTLQKLAKRVLFDNHYPLYSLDKEYHDFIWRKAFDNAMDPHYRKNLMNQDFVISNFNKFILRCKLNFNLSVPSLDTKGMDFAIFQHGLPLAPKVSAGTIPLIRFHDTVPLQFPDTVANLQYSKSHARGILSSAKKAYFVCNSLPVKEELIDLLPEIEDRIYVIPPPLLTEGTKVEKNVEALPGIFASYRYQKQEILAKNEKKSQEISSDKQFDPFSVSCTNYIISVSNLEPRKNFISLIRAWERLRYQKDDNLKLVVVGNPGWKCKPVLDAMKPHIIKGDIIHLANVPFHELKMLYACARAFVFPSYYEGFGSTPVEAVSEGCPALVSDIPVMRWVLGDAALYCNPYDIGSIVDGMERLLYSPESEQLRQDLITKGFKRLELYSLESVGNQWRDLFAKLKQLNQSA